MTHRVCTAALPPPRKRPSFMLSYNCWLFSLDWGLGLFQFLLTNLSLPSLWVPLSSLHFTWQFCLKSGYYSSYLVLERSVLCCDGICTQAHTSESLWGSPGSSSSKLSWELLCAALCWMPPVRGEREEGAQKELQLPSPPSRDQLLVKSMGSIWVATSQPSVEALFL